MSDFVNYNKRDVSLPPGCKNLTDVLQAQASLARANFTSVDAASSANKTSVLCKGKCIGGRDDVEKYLVMVYTSQAQTFMLSVSTPDRKFTLEVFRKNDGTILSNFRVPNNSDRAKTVRAFFAQHGLDVPKESGTPPHFHPDLPWEYSFDISPLPPEPKLMAKLATDLFQEVFGLVDDSKLSFEYVETKGF